MNVLEFENIGLKIGNSVILEDVSFAVEQGGIYGLIGHNGAGKTSLIRILLGLTTRYSGSVRINGSGDLCANRKLIGAVTDSARMDKSLTAERYIRRIGYMLGENGRGYEQELLEKVGLSEVGKKRISAFSLGMKRRLIMAGALVGSPEILVLDEPFNGIDPEGMSEMRLMLGRLSNEGITVLVTSHNIPELIKLASVFGVMCGGKFMGSIGYAELSATVRKKTVFKTDDPHKLASEIKSKFPQYRCENAAGEIMIFEEPDRSRCEEIRAAVTPGLIKDILTESMSEEEILLWKMNGHAK